MCVRVCLIGVGCVPVWLRVCVFGLVCLFVSAWPFDKLRGCVCARLLVVFFFCVCVACVGCVCLFMSVCLFVSVLVCLSDCLCWLVCCVVCPCVF